MSKSKCEICGRSPLTDATTILRRVNALGVVPAIWHCEECNHQLLDAEQRAKDATDEAYEPVKKILEQRGWKYTSSTPGSCWMWEKKLIDGRVVLVDIHLAIQFEIRESNEGYVDENS